MIQPETDTSDQLIWKSMCAGDERSFALIFGRYHRTLYNYGYKLSGESDMVEDAIQEVFIDLWRWRESLEKEVKSVKFYLYRALRRRLHKASLVLEKHEELEWDEEGVLDVSGQSHEELLIQDEVSSLLSERIRELLQLLPERQLEAVTLRYFEGFSIEDISSIMEVSEKSVRNFLYKALVLLKENRHWLAFSLVFLLGRTA